MPQHFVRNESSHREVGFEAAMIQAAAQRATASRKRPTSVALDAQLIAELKAEADAAASLTKSS